NRRRGFPFCRLGFGLLYTQAFHVRIDLFDGSETERYVFRDRVGGLTRLVGFCRFRFARAVSSSGTHATNSTTYQTSTVSKTTIAAGANRTAIGIEISRT